MIDAQRDQAAGRKRCEIAGARAAGNDVETALGIVIDRLRHRRLSGDDAAEVASRRHAELNVDIGEAEIAVEQQGPVTGLGQGMRQGDRKPSLADAALAGSDGDDVALAQGGIRCRAGGGSSFHGGGCHRARSGMRCTSACGVSGMMRRASATGLRGNSPWAISGVMLASQKLSCAASAAASWLLRR